MKCKTTITLSEHTKTEEDLITIKFLFLDVNYFIQQNLFFYNITVNKIVAEDNVQNFFFKII